MIGRITLALGMVLAVGLSATYGEDKVVFEDRLRGKLAEGWSWLREDPDTWRFHDEGLEIRVEPGVATTVKNALVRKAPDRSSGKFAVDVTVTTTAEMVQQYEQAGITWYHDGKPILKIVKELIDGELYALIGSTGGSGRKPMTSETVQLRLIVSETKCVGQYRPDGQGEFITIAEVDMPAPVNDEVSIQCYNGPPDGEHWIRFKDFRITQLAD
jgi:regulation of enolase protein 1 (concanavalin A-like superfamily)